MNPLAATILFVLVVGVLFAPKRWALISLTVSALYLTYGAGIQIAGFYVFPTRLLAYICFIRVLSKGEFSFHQLLRADKAIILLYSYTALILILRQDGSMALAVAKALDGVLTYLIFRAFFQTFDDLKWFSNILVILLVPYVAILSFELFTQRNLFSLVGSGTEVWLRDEKVRCYGSFRHPSLLGSLGACFLPMFAGLIADPLMRKRMVLGCALCVAIVLASNSGGPMSVLAVAVIGWALWPLRMRMQSVRRWLLGCFVLLAMIMNAPVWYLLARISSFTGGTGWHRSYLMDVAFKNFSQWAFIGTPIENTAGWFPYVLETTGGADITNQYLVFGIQAGVVAILLFVQFIYRAFSSLGKALAAARQSEQGQVYEAILWGLGVALAAHISNWFGITYFDQFHLLWLLQMGVLVSLSQFVVSNQMHPVVLEASLNHHFESASQEGTPQTCHHLIFGQLEPVKPQIPPAV